MKKVITVFILIFISASAFTQNMPLRRFGLFVGANNGGDERTVLRYANQDAQTMMDVMSEVGGIQHGDFYLLEDPHSEDIVQALEAMKNRVSSAHNNARRTEFFFYYSGHSDEQGILLGDQRFGYRELKDLIDEIEADIHIAVLDSCSSGAFTRMKGGVREAPFLFDDSSEMSGHAFITSSSAEEASQESDRIGGSFFTHHFVTGLRGAADASSDGQVTLNEAYEYAFDETLSSTEVTYYGPQHPSYDIQLAGTGDLVLTDLRNVQAILGISPEVAGRIFVRDAEGRLIAEMQKQEGATASLALPAGSYRITLQSENGSYGASAELTGISQLSLSFQDFRPEGREVNQRRGNEEQPLAAGEGDAVNMVSDFLQSMLSTMAVDSTEEDIASFALSPVTSTAQSVDGFQVAGVMSVAEGGMNGAQGAGIGVITEGDISGAQMAGVFTIGEGSLSGVQFSGVFNINSGIRAGFYQGAGVFNIAEGSFTGGQGAGVFNLCQDLTGVQSSGVFNIAEGQVIGAQLAGVFNYSDALNGVQMAPVNITGDVSGFQSGVLNISENFSGVQSGVCNIAEDLSGVQAGVVNIAESNRGLAIGLINIIGDGILDVEAWYTDSNYIFGQFKSGTNALYTAFSAGIIGDNMLRETDGAPPFAAGIALGTRLCFGILYADIEAGSRVAFASEYWDFQSGHLQYMSVFPTLRGVAGVSLGNLGLFCGYEVNVLLPDFMNPSAFHSGAKTDFPVGDVSTELYPSFIFGLRI